MSDLEDQGYIGHPHTSAGRIPTDKGYRFYVDSLINLEQLTEKDQSTIHAQMEEVAETEELLKETSRIISAISHQLGVVMAPRLSTGVLEKIELISLSSTRIMIIISIRSGLVKTMMMEVKTEFPRTKLEEIGQLLNERLAGLTFRQIRQSFPTRMKDVEDEETGLIRLFVDSVDKLFSESTAHDMVHFGGAGGLLAQPEFKDTEKFRSIIELLENEDIVVHVLESIDPKSGSINVSIGSENADEKLRELAVITSQYAIGEMSGTVGILGSKRMDYARVIPLVDYVARTISTIFNR
jgi:heat-inducible transcriptional repressor